MALSDAWLKANSGKKREKRFEKVDRDGLSVRVTPQEKVTFQLRYRYDGKAARVDLGSYPLMTLKNARNARGIISTSPTPAFIKRHPDRYRPAVAVLTSRTITRVSSVGYGVCTTVLRL